MPKGVEHAAIYNAMVIHYNQVQTSVMPKGVEHLTRGIGSGGMPSVQTSVMPKGVEHTIRRGRSRRWIRVQTSVMPKGVEHIWRDSSSPTGARCADLCDAERR